MPGRHVLLFDSLGVSAYRWQGGQLRQEQEFRQENPDPIELSQFLGERRGDLFYILTDLTDEAFQLEAIPPVRGRDRRILIDRKLGQHFRGTPLRAAISLGHGSEGRRDERLLLCALPSHAQFEPWLRCLRQVGARLVGVFSLPVVIASMASKLFGPTDRALIVCVARSGVRQTFLDQGRLRFSRLTPLMSDSSDDLASVVAAESGRTHKYLVGQRLVASDSPLPVLVLAHPAHFDAIRALLPGSAASPVRCVDLAALGESCKLPDKLDDSRSLELWLHLLVRYPPRDQFASCEDRRFYQLGKVGLGLRAAAVAALIISLAFAGASILQARNDSSRAEQLAADIAIDERQLQQSVATLPAGAISTERLRVLASRVGILERRSDAPEHLLRQLADTLTQVPDIQLERLTWRMASTLDAAMADSKLPASDQGYVVMEAQAALPSRPTGDGDDPRSAIDRLLASAAGRDGMAAGTSDPGIAVDSTRGLRGGTQPGTADPLHFSFWLVRAL